MAGMCTSSAYTTLPSFDDCNEEDPMSLRIPPLRSMFISLTPDRPIALEPFPTPNVDGPATKLTGRQVALAQAKTMEELKPGDLDAVQSPETYRVNSTKMTPMDEHNKKRRKLAHKEQVLDFVHLPKPKPKAKLEEVNRKPFQPIAVLNQLNEPPPSAALFPPITPSKEEYACSILPDSDHSPTKTHQDSCSSLPQQSPTRTEKSKRVYLRPRRKWTESETNHLIEGIALCGVGRWKDILSHPKFHFHESRTHVDLKDRFRTLYPQQHPEKWAGRMSDSKECGKPGSQPTQPTQPAQGHKCTGKRATYRNWSDLEDVELDKGFEKYGFQWNLIAQDESLAFDNRSANQIRDRFRRRYPEKYGEPAPEPATENMKKAKKYLEKTSHKKHMSSANAQKVQESADATAPNFDAVEKKVVEQGRAGPGSLTALAFPDGLLNRENLENDSGFRESLAALDSDLKLPPLQWDDMAVQPIFDLG